MRYVERDGQAACLDKSLVECAPLAGADYLERCSADGKLLLSCDLDVLYASYVVDCSAEGKSCVVTSQVGEAVCR